ncbi:phospholipase DDHD2-like [Rhopilema esculentum]|uniref:phospholipase DDHD2-like n=1 Tax=Rhopilema esculentum TaxID=499914 RepID=UPI0031DCF751
MAANQNNRERGNQPNYGQAGQSPFFNQSLGGGLTVDSLAGPRLFTPIPLSAPANPSTPIQGSNAAANIEPPSQALGYTTSSSTLFASPSVPPSSGFLQASFSQQELFTAQNNQNQDPFAQNFVPQETQQPPVQTFNEYQDPSYMTPQLSDAPPPSQVYDQFGASPGMQYMETPFQDYPQRQTDQGSFQDLAGNMHKPTQVVSPQPSQDLYGRPPQPQFYSPSGHPVQAPTYFYQPIQPHWFYHKGGKIWLPFSYVDSRNLEAAFQSKERTVIATDGGRFDVDIDSMKREAIYWVEARTEVRRCSWFYRGEGDTKLVPYSENMAELLEKEYKLVATTGAWNKKLDLKNGESVIFHNQNVIVHYLPTTDMYDWTGEDSKSRPRVVRRGITDIVDEIVEGEPEQIDHLVFVVHGIGPAADLRMRPLVECVDDMRQQGLHLLGTHQFVKEGIPVGRVEFLPIEWYSNLHSDRHGVDNRLNAITLSSINKFRNFTNETLTDILFFTSPMYCQAICDTVVQEMNRLLLLFTSRNQSFQGQLSVCGHSLGSCILFDILANQVNIETADDTREVVEEILHENTSDENTESSPVDEDFVETPVAPPPVLTHSLSQTYASTVQEDSIPDIEDVLKKLSLSDYLSKFHEEKIDTETLLMCSEADMRDLGIPMGPRKKLMGFVREQAQHQEKKKAADTRSEPTPKTVAAASNSAATQASAAQKSVITKGTQTYLFRSFSSASVEVAYERGVAGTGQPTVHYSKLSFEPVNMFALGSPIGLFVTVRGVTSFGINFKLPTCNSFYNIFHPYDPVAYRIEPLVNPTIEAPPVLMPHHKGRKRFHLELRENLTRVGANLKQGFIEAVRSTWETINHFARSHRTEALDSAEDETETAVVKPLQNVNEETQVEHQEPEPQIEPTGPELGCGKLNNGKRIDFVLQERPLESLNEYLFALSSHTCYWTSEDTVLLMLRAIYGAE